MAKDAQAQAPRSRETEPASAVDRVLATLKGGMPDRQGRHILVRALLAPADAATLDTLKTSDLVALVDHAMAFLQEKPVGAPKVAVRQLAGDSAVLEILNQDMPFLLDSVFGELHARGLPIGLVLHPLIKTERAADGKLVRIAGAGDRQWSDGRQESYIAVHLERLPAGEGEAIAKVVAAILDEVRTVVGDWQPMLARLRKAISDLEAAPASVPEPQRNEAVAFLKWLEAGNMTLLGMRDYRLDGDMQTGTLRGNGCDGPRAAAGPDAEGAASRQRVRHPDAGDPQLLPPAEPAHHHQGQRPQPRPPARAHGLHRRQDLRRRRPPHGRVAHRRPLHVAGLRQVAARDPVPAPQGGARARPGRLPAGEPCRQIAGQRARYLPARRAVPDQRRRSRRVVDGDPRSRT